jgi:nicotinate-nucleotide adenylyltransferase
VRIALFGGTFDPIHNAHLAVAREAVRRCRLDRLLFIPAGRPPHKASAHAPFEDRVRMLEIACEGEPVFGVSRLEQGDRRSYSIHTIERFRGELGAADELFFVIGADAFAEIRTWLRWQEVVGAVQFIIVSRPGHDYAAPPGARVERLDNLELPISSTAIREALQRGCFDVEAPRGVINYIRERGLYGTLQISHPV